MVPVLQNVLALVEDYVAMCPHPLPAEGPIFVGARGGPLSARIIQLTMERLRGALGLPDSATAACAATFLSQPTFCPAAAICARSRNCSATLRFSTTQIYTGIDSERCWNCTRRRIPRLKIG